MKLEVSAHGGVLKVSLIGCFEASKAVGLADWICWFLSGRQFDSVEIDLRQCTEIGSPGLAGLVGFRLHPNVSSKPARISGCSEKQLEFCSTLQMDRIFEISVDQ